MRHLIPGHIEVTALVLFHQTQLLHGLNIVKDVTVLAVQVFCQGIDAGMPHAAQFGQQFETITPAEPSLVGVPASFPV
jgi:hypothetical protein